MTDFYNLQSSDLNEIIWDSDVFLHAIETGSLNNTVLPNKYGNIFLKAKKRGNLYTSNTKVLFKENVRITSELSPMISLNFNLGGCAYYNNDIKRRDRYKLNQHHCSLNFMNQNAIGESLYKKDMLNEYYNIHFPPEYFKILVHLYPELLESSYQMFTKGHSFLANNQPIPITTNMQQIIAQINQADLLGNSNSMYVESKILEILALYFLNDNKSPKVIKTNIDKEKIIAACNLLTQDLTETPTLRSLSLSVGINEKKLKQGFKEVYGSTVFGYLFQYKMKLAQEYLKDTRLTIMDIAILCGYEHLSHFSTAFKRFSGVSPLKYKNSYKQ